MSVKIVLVQRPTDGGTPGSAELLPHDVGDEEALALRQTVPGLQGDLEETGGVLSSTQSNILVRREDSCTEYLVLTILQWGPLSLVEAQRGSALIGSLWHKDSWLPCTERSYYGALMPYRTSEEQEKSPS